MPDNVVQDLLSVEFGDGENSCWEPTIDTEPLGDVNAPWVYSGLPPRTEYIELSSDEDNVWKCQLSQPDVMQHIPGRKSLGPRCETVTSTTVARHNSTTSIDVVDKKQPMVNEVQKKLSKVQPVKLTRVKKPKPSDKVSANNIELLLDIQKLLFKFRKEKKILLKIQKYLIDHNKKLNLK